MVYLDNREVGKTPLDAYRVPSGDYLLQVKKEFYKDHQSQISIADGETLTQSVSLPGDFGRVMVEGSPLGAKILVDGEAMGAIPGLLEPVAVGSRQIRIDAGPHYRVHDQTIFVGLDQQVNLKINLKELKGSLLATSKPAGASIIIDGNPIPGAVTQYTVKELWAGEHWVSLDLEGFAPASKQILIQEDQRELFSADLERLIYVKPRAEALWRSALVPGFGQYYAGRKQWGGVYLAAQLGLFVSLNNQKSEYDDLHADYLAKRSYYETYRGTQTELTALWGDVEAAYDEKEANYSRQQVTIGLMLGTYLWNVADSWLFMPRRPESSFSAGLTTDGDQISAQLKVSLP